MFDRIKIVQSKIFASPDDSHLLTIALDGENSWENYPDDGAGFLREIYSLIENDDTLETVLISDYIQQDKNIKNYQKFTPVLGLTEISKCGLENLPKSGLELFKKCSR